MNESNVYFVPGRRNESPEHLEEIAQVLYSKIRPREGLSGPAFVKIHVGERDIFDGTLIDTHIRPDFVRPFVKLISRDVESIVTTDSTPNYSNQQRSKVQGHRALAWEHGFRKQDIGARFVVADAQGNMTWKHDRLGKIEMPRVYYDTALMGGWGIILTHFTGHEIYAFGGNIKNLGMGLVGSDTKGLIHHFKANVDQKLCKGCYKCMDKCTFDAIKKVSNESRAPVYVGEPDCKGCATCIPACNYGALDMNMGTVGNRKTIRGRKAAGEYITESLVIAAKEVVNQFQPEHLLYVTDLTKMTVYCDCDAPLKAEILKKRCAQYLGRDRGYLASTDPVALDKACIDLIKQSITTAQWHKRCGTRPFYFPVALNQQVNMAAEIGLGNKQYQLVTINV
jgi:uncharacterized Fe-S center protein